MEQDSRDTGAWCVPDEFDGKVLFDAIATHLGRSSSKPLLLRQKLTFQKSRLLRLHAEHSAMEQWLAIDQRVIGSRCGQELETKLRQKSVFLEREDLAHLALDGLDYLELQAEFSQKCEALLAPALLHQDEVVEVCRYLGSIFNENLEIADKASDKLFSLRKELRHFEARMRTELAQIVKEADLAPYLQEDFWVELNGRMVLLIKAESRHRVKGIAHGVSHSQQTIYVEPLALVELNHSLEQLVLQEKAEIYRILVDCNTRLRPLSGQFVQMIQRLRWLDVLRAKVLFSASTGGTLPQISEREEFEILGFWHPFVADCVSNDLRLREEQRILILSGPNAGGKTVTMKSVALCYYFAALGLKVCARSCILPVIERLQFLMGDYQSLMDSLSSFSAHLSRWREVLKSANIGSFLFVDEIMNATDPREGERLALHLIRWLGKNGVRAIISTHYSELKHLALESATYVNASMIFDVNKLRPTFMLSVGVPGNSYGIQLARQFNLPEEVVQAAESDLGDAHFKMRDLLEEEKRELVRLRRLREKSREVQQTLLSIKTSAERLLQQFDQDRDRILSRLHLRLEKDLHRYHKEWDQRLSDLSEQLGKQESAEESVATVRRELKIDYESRMRFYQKQYQTRNHQSALSVGDWVKLPQGGKSALIKEINPSRRRVKVSLDGKLITLDLADLDLNPISQAPLIKGGVLLGGGSEVDRIDLRGLSVDDAVIELEMFLDRAVLAHLTSVEIIHGKGVLRSAALELLRRSTVTAHCRIEHPNDGSLTVFLGEKA